MCDVRRKLLFLSQNSFVIFCEFKGALKIHFRCEIIWIFHHHDDTDSVNIKKHFECFFTTFRPIIQSLLPTLTLVSPKVTHITSDFHPHNHVCCSPNYIKNLTQTKRDWLMRRRKLLGEVCLGEFSNWHGIYYMRLPFGVFLVNLVERSVFFFLITEEGAQFDINWVFF